MASAVSLRRALTRNICLTVYNGQAPTNCQALWHRPACPARTCSTADGPPEQTPGGGASRSSTCTSGTSSGQGACRQRSARRKCPRPLTVPHSDRVYPTPPDTIESGRELPSPLSVGAQLPSAADTSRLRSGHEQRRFKKANLMCGQTRPLDAAPGSTAAQPSLRPPHAPVPLPAPPFRGSRRFPYRGGRLQPRE